MRTWNNRSKRHKLEEEEEDGERQSSLGVVL